jgi:cellulose synthase/poly-beta-1,6-N-acetylglucosamine synthase-like glycosyltransferase/peptidoglycan/xylan/chitin deacetylase (PgdA/CDA1 family)/spore germination protein YaaH
VTEARRPIFYDSSGRRRRRFAFAAVVFALLLALSIGIFTASIVEVTPQIQLPFQVERPPLHGPSQVDLIGHAARIRLKAALRDAKRLAQAKGSAAPPLAISFHAPWDDSSAASLARHVDDLDWLIPGWISVTGPGHRVTTFADPAGRAIIAGAVHRPKILPMVQNALEGEWDGTGAAALLHDPKARSALLDHLERFLTINHARGVMFDFEELPASAQSDYLRFLRETRARFAPHRWLVTLAVPVDNADWDLPAFAAVADKLFVMAYDEHYPGGPPGPIASRAWFEAMVGKAVRSVPPGKAVVAVGSYSYDWTRGGDTDAISVDEAWLRAKESGVFPTFDAASGNSSFSYQDGSVAHDVWLLDEAAVNDQIRILQGLGINEIALWRLGTEDPATWSLFGRHRALQAQAGSVLERIPAGNDVDIEGIGEVLKVGAVRSPGVRQLMRDKHGFVVNEKMIVLPSPFVIERAGYKPGLVALTFDDGPDPTWTPRILDELKAARVPATFFIIGENALTQQSLLERLVAEGHEVGNHTYTHPNLGRTSPGQTRLELNATQRLFQAFTGHSLRLFRAPFFGDAEPTTTDEIIPVSEAQDLGYLSVGLHVDPGDWKRPGVGAIVQRTVDAVLASSQERSGQVVLLHDGGGDRSQTVQALPAIISQLRVRGYRFVPVSGLIGLRTDQVMPSITKSDRMAAEADLALFGTLAATTRALGWIFLVAISLGILRAVLLSGLALWQSRRESRVLFPRDDGSFVSVLIPAHNEEKVIERTVRRVLASEDITLEVIVVDDGSRDATGAIVRRAFAGDSRVRLLSLVNSGKATALNEGLELVHGDIVIALDADTQFEPRTISRLARWFDDPKIGAVAGNAKVGNRVNLVTRWQALEYITAQNLERRALARMQAITVVPGAVGAWRLQALRDVGGYPPDTLAEDQDLTIAIQRAGWTVHYDQYAVAWTEAPETFRALARQRFRWAFGTLQCLWKHKSIIRTGRPRGLAYVGLPQAILFQILFASISPLIDLALLVAILTTALGVEEHGWAQTSGSVERMAVYWLVFTLADFLSGVIAMALERREDWRLLWLMLPQRIGYRQVMYYVVLKALTQAVRGALVGWGKLERSGRVGAPH